MSLKNFIAACTFAGLAFALPSKRACPAIAHNTQSCTASDRGPLLAAYGVHIGIAYNGGSGCDDVFNKLKSVGNSPITNWQCVDDGCGDTQLYFNDITGDSKYLNQALEAEYPTVNGFNCPDY